MGNENESPDLEELLNWLVHLPDEQRVELLQEIGQGAEADFQENFRGLQQLIIQSDPLVCLAHLGLYGLMSPEGQDPELDRENPVLPFEVELIQALALCHELKDYGAAKPISSKAVELRDLSQRAHKAFAHRRFAQLKNGESIAERVRLSAEEYMRMDTEVLRNWGTPQQMQRIISELFHPLEEDIYQEAGVRISSLIEMFNRLLYVIEERANAHLDRVRTFISSETFEQLAENYLRAFPDIQMEKEEVLNALRKAPSLIAARTTLMMHSDLRLPDIFAFSLEDLIELYKSDVKREDLLAILRLWSFQFGDLKNSNPEHFFLGNPIWDHPFIHLENDIFFYPIPSLIISSITSLMERIIVQDENLKQRYEERRGAYLEIASEQVFQSAFPDAHIYRGTKWPEDQPIFENDLLIVLDNYGIVIEDKGGSVSPAARRGAIRSLEDVVEALHYDPTQQGLRFIKYLRENPGLHRFETAQRGVFNEINTTNVRHYIQLNCTLEELPVLTLGWRQLKTAGLLPDDVEPIPNISLANVETIFEVLPTQAARLHYLLRRTSFEAGIEYTGDEMDLLAFYLQSRFLVRDDRVYYLHGKSLELRPALMGNKPIPQIELPVWWKRIFEFVERRHVSHWTSVTTILLNTTDDEVKQLYEYIEQQRQLFNDMGSSPEKDNGWCITCVADEIKTTICVYVYKNLSEDERNQRMSGITANVLEQTNTQRGIIIGIDVNQDLDKGYPYSVLGYFPNS